MDKTQQAVLFYKSLASADTFSCKLLARGARMQRGRVAELERKITDLKLKNAPTQETDQLQAEADKRQALATTFDELDTIIDGAIAERETLDEEKFK
jgi:hypothetical protein